jgi:lysophospholipase L1-like esterase
VRLAAEELRASMKWILLCVAVLLPLCLVECGLQVREHRTNLELQQKRLPYYSISFFTTEGEPISNLRGMLALQLEPGIIYGNQPDQKTEYFSIDAAGFRTVPTDRTSNRARIVLVGGSAAFGTGLESDDETFAAHLARRLPETEVINAAVIGHASGQELVRLVTELLDLEPQLVIALDGINEALVPQYMARAAYGQGFNGLNQIEEQLGELQMFTAPNPLRRIAFGLPRLLFPNLFQYFERPKPLRPVSLQRAATIYVRNTRKMQRIANAHGAGFLCAIQPHRDLVLRRKRPTPFGRAFGRMRTMAKKGFRSHEIDFIDLNEGIALAPDMFLDAMHLNSRGYAALAERVSATIRAKEMLPAR